MPTPASWASRLASAGGTSAGLTVASASATTLAKRNRYLRRASDEIRSTSIAASLPGSGTYDRLSQRLECHQQTSNNFAGLKEGLENGEQTIGAQRPHLGHRPPDHPESCRCLADTPECGRLCSQIFRQSTARSNSRRATARASAAVFRHADARTVGDITPNVQVISIHTPLFGHHLDAAAGRALAREVNDEMAEMTRQWPRRFARLAPLPVQGVPRQAIDELERAVTVLGLKGAELAPRQAPPPDVSLLVAAEDAAGHRARVLALVVELGSRHERRLDALGLGHEAPAIARRERRRTSAPSPSPSPRSKSTRSATLPS